MEYKTNYALYRHRAEAVIIGRLLTAFCELEYAICAMAGRAVNNLWPVINALYRLKATSSRIEVADAVMRPSFQHIKKLECDYQMMLSALKYCMRIRNQYSHCTWRDWGPNIFFADLEESAEAEDGFELRWYHVSIPLLETQEEYFGHTQSWLYYLEDQLSLSFGRQVSPPRPKPSATKRPLLHNPASIHVPQWLSPAEKARHLERTFAVKEVPHTRSRIQSPSPRDREPGGVEGQ